MLKNVVKNVDILALEANFACFVFKSKLILVKKWYKFNAINENFFLTLMKSDEDDDQSWHFYFNLILNENGRCADRVFHLKSN